MYANNMVFLKERRQDHTKYANSIVFLKERMQDHTSMQTTASTNSTCEEQRRHLTEKSGRNTLIRLPGSHKTHEHVDQELRHQSDADGNGFNHESSHKSVVRKNSL